MNRIRLTFAPVLGEAGFTPEELTETYYRLTSDEQGALMFETDTVDVLDAGYNPGQEITDSMVLDAVSSTYGSRFTRSMAALQRAFNRQLPDSLKIPTVKGKAPEEYQPVIGNPRRAGGFATVTAQFPFPDGQTVSVVFHAPGADGRISNGDELIAYRWLLNKRDITIAVAPEMTQGIMRDIPLQTVARRVTQLLEKNSDKFSARQTQAAEQKADLEKAENLVKELDDRTVLLTDELGELETKSSKTAGKVETLTERLNDWNEKNSDLLGQIEQAKTLKISSPLSAVDKEDLIRLPDQVITHKDVMGGRLEFRSPKGFKTKKINHKSIVVTDENAPNGKEYRFKYDGIGYAKGDQYLVFDGDDVSVSSTVRSLRSVPGFEFKDEYDMGTNAYLARELQMSLYNASIGFLSATIGDDLPPREQLKLGQALNKSERDQFIKAKFGVDAYEARKISNLLTHQDILGKGFEWNKKYGYAPELSDFPEVKAVLDQLNISLPETEEEKEERLHDAWFRFLNSGRLPKGWSWDKDDLLAGKGRYVTVETNIIDPDGEEEKEFDLMMHGDDEPGTEKVHLYGAGGGSELGAVDDVKAMAALIKQIAEEAHGKPEPSPKHDNTKNGWLTPDLPFGKLSTDTASETRFFGTKVTYKNQYGEVFSNLTVEKIANRGKLIFFRNEDGNSFRGDSEGVISIDRLVEHMEPEPEELTLRPGDMEIDGKSVKISQIDHDAGKVTYTDPDANFMNMGAIGRIATFEKFEDEYGVKIKRRPRLEDDGSIEFLKARIEQLDQDIENDQGVSGIGRDNLAREKRELYKRLAVAQGVNDIEITDELVDQYRKHNYMEGVVEWAKNNGYDSNIGYHLYARVEEEANKRHKAAFDARPDVKLANRIGAYLITHHKFKQSSGGVAYLPVGVGKVDVERPEISSDGKTFNLKAIYHSNNSQDTTFGYKDSEFKKEYPIVEGLILDSAQSVLDQIGSDISGFVYRFKTVVDTSDLPEYSEKKAEISGLAAKEIKALIMRDVKTDIASGKLPQGLAVSATSSNKGGKSVNLKVTLPDSMPMFNQDFLNEDKDDRYRSGIPEYHNETRALLSRLKALGDQYNDNDGDHYGDYGAKPSFYFNLDVNYDQHNERMESEDPKNAKVKEEPRIPDNVWKEVERAFNNLSEKNSRMDELRELDQTQGGEGRYEYEGWRNGISESVENSRNKLAEIRQHAKSKGIDLDAEITARLGELPDARLGSEGWAWLKDQNEIKERNNKQQGTTAATVSGWNDLKKQVIDNLSMIRGIDTGAEGHAGYDRGLFVKSITDKLKRLEKNDRGDLVNLAQELVEETQAKWDKPAITARNGMWKLAGYQYGSKKPRTDQEINDDRAVQEAKEALKAEIAYKADQTARAEFVGSFSGMENFIKANAARSAIVNDYDEIYGMVKRGSLSSVDAIEIAKKAQDAGFSPALSVESIIKDLKALEERELFYYGMENRGYMGGGVPAEWEAVYSKDDIESNPKLQSVVRGWPESSHRHGVVAYGEALPEKSVSNFQLWDYQKKQPAVYWGDEKLSQEVDKFAEQMKSFDGDFMDFMYSARKSGLFPNEKGKQSHAAMEKALGARYPKAEDDYSRDDYVSLSEKLWLEHTGKDLDGNPVAPEASNNDGDAESILNKIIAGGYSLEEAGEKLDALADELEAAGTGDQYSDLIEKALEKFGQMDAELGDS